MREWLSKAKDKVVGWGKSAWRWFLVAVLGIAVIPMTLAENKEFNWSMPTSRIDGTPLAISELASTTLYCAKGSGALVEIASVPAPATTRTQELSAGSYRCMAKVTDTNGQMSDFSNEVVFEIIPGRPSPPVLSVGD